jgi:hypothetical protein
LWQRFVGSTIRKPRQFVGLEFGSLSEKGTKVIPALMEIHNSLVFGNDRIPEHTGVVHVRGNVQATIVRIGLSILGVGKEVQDIADTATPIALSSRLEQSSYPTNSASSLHVQSRATYHSSW